MRSKEIDGSSYRYQSVAVRLHWVKYGRDLGRPQNADVALCDFIVQDGVVGAVLVLQSLMDLRFK